MACAQQHADLPGCDKTWQQTQFNHRRFHRLPPCASPESHSRHPYHATLNLKMRSVRERNPIICRNMQDRNQEGQPLGRRVLLRSGVIFTGTVLASSALLRGVETKNKGKEKEAEVGPAEDVMREHGVLKRVLSVLGEDFEKKEDELFGEDGFEKVVGQVAGIEQQLGIYDLAQFTPKM